MEINNFRGIRALDWRHIGKTRALVGPGDSGKSTILEAIERVFSPRWNVPFDDSDFWSLDTAADIRICATITDLKDSFYRDTKFGLYLHAFDDSLGKAVRASGAEREQYAVVVELSVDSSLEPSWNIVDAEDEKHSLRARDREALGMLRVGSYIDQHFGWSKGSALTRLTKSAGDIEGVLAEAARRARLSVKADELEELVHTAKQVEELGIGLGVYLSDELTPQLDASSLSVAAGALSLHSGLVPVRRTGLGTRRLLAVAMQRAGVAQAGLTIVDEFEHGLEPHRIRQLIRALQGRPPASSTFADGQLILTTHSPTVISELSSDEISITRRADDGAVGIVNLPAEVQYILQRTPGALLARRVIVAEGATEDGFIAALDEEWESETSTSFGYHGVAIVNGEGGTQPAELAGHFVALGYETALLIDSDAKARIGKAEGATVLAWPGGMCTEQRLALDLPESALREMTQAAAATSPNGPRSVLDTLADVLSIARGRFDIGTPMSWLDEAESLNEYRRVLGDTAKDKKWFKNYSSGKFLGRLVTQHWDDIDGTPTHQVLTSLRAFVHG